MLNRNNFIAQAAAAHPVTTQTLYCLQLMLSALETPTYLAFNCVNYFLARPDTSDLCPDAFTHSFDLFNTTSNITRVGVNTCKLFFYTLPKSDLHHAPFTLCDVKPNTDNQNVLGELLFDKALVNTTFVRDFIESINITIPSCTPGSTVPMMNLTNSTFRMMNLTNATTSMMNLTNATVPDNPASYAHNASHAGEIVAIVSAALLLLAAAGYFFYRHNCSVFAGKSVALSSYDKTTPAYGTANDNHNDDDKRHGCCPSRSGFSSA